MFDEKCGRVLMQKKRQDIFNRYRQAMEAKVNG